jgi:hypothetical protein
MASREQHGEPGAGTASRERKRPEELELFQKRLARVSKKRVVRNRHARGSSSNCITIAAE